MPSLRSLLAVAAALALVAVSSASGDPIDGYTATAAPALVKPSAQTTFTIALTNKPTSSKEADRAKIGIPADFAVDGATVQATASAAGGCAAATWVADGTLILDGKVNLKRPGGGLESRLCPGATLTVTFSATPSAADGIYVWATQLLRGEDTFVLNGSQPSVRVDGTPPTVTIGSYPADPSNDPSPAFGFSASESATFECRLDGGVFGACASPKSYSGLSDGSHTFTVRATDAAGNIGAASYTWLIETTLPIVTLTDKPVPASKSSAASFSFTASKPASFECKLDGGDFAACTSPTSYSSLADGSHTFAVKATDGVGNTGPQTTHTWTVDTVSPSVAISKKPTNPSNDGSPAFEFSASESATVECKLEGGAFSACASPKSYVLGDGQHTFTVKATDPAGNSGQMSYAWTIDTVAPTLSITQKPSNPSNVKSPTFVFSAHDGGGLQSVQCKLDGAAFAACTSPHSYSEPGDGSHTFTVRAADGAGNSAQESHTWIIDTLAPTVTITQKPNDPSGVATAAFAFSAAEPATFQCKLDGVAFAACTSPKSYANLSDAVHLFTVKATDSAGNTGAEETHSWLVETNLPVVTLTDSPPKVSSSSTANFAFTVSKPSATLECKLDGESDFQPCDSPKTYNNLSDGSHIFAVRGKGTGGTGPPTTYTWTIDTTGPAVAITEKPADPTNSRSATFAFSSNEAGATFQCKLDDGAFAVCTSPQSYGNLGEGRHTFAVRALDALSNIGPEAQYAWTIESRAPGLTITSAPPDLSNSAAASFSFEADEPSTFQCNLDDRGFEPCSSPASYGGLRDGGHAFAVRATDAAGNVGAASRSWTIDSTAPQTTIDSAPVASTTSRVAAFVFSASEQASFECRLDDASFAPCSSPKAYSSLVIGRHRFAVRAVDPAGNVDATPATAEWTISLVVKRAVARSALFAPAAGARVTRPPLLRWRAVKRATYYNVQLYRAGRKVLSAWPVGPRLQLRSRWRFNGRAEGLKAGTYRWYVWPGYGKQATRRYGGLLGTSTFIVGRTTQRR